MLGRALRAAPRGSFRPKGRRSAVVTVGATSITMNGPTSGTVGLASSPFAIGVNGTVGTNIVVTPSDGGGGTFSVPSVTLTALAPSATFTYTPGSIGSRTISVTSNPVLAYPPAITFTATGVTALVWGSYPTSGTVSVASTPFTISANGPVGTSIVVTMSDAANGGTFTPTTVTLTTGSPSATFTYTPASTGAKTISVTSNPVLGYPTPITYTSNAVVSDATWSGIVPAISFTQGSTAGSPYDLTQYTSNFNTSLHQMAVTSGTLPSGVTLNPTGSYVYNGSGAAASATPIVLTIQDTAEADWLARSGAAGVTYFQDFRNAATVTPFFFDNGLGEVASGYISRVTNEGLTGGACLRFISPAAYTGTASHVFRHPLNSAWTTNSQHFGTTPFWFSWRMKINSGRINSTGGGWKFFNLASFSINDGGLSGQSNTTAEIVGQDTYCRGFPQAYYQDGSGFASFEQNGPGGDINFQNARDAGVGLPNADRYCLYPGGGTAGCWRWVADEWMTFKAAVTFGTYNGSAGNRFRMWGAYRNATAWVPLIDVSNFTLGSPQSGYNGSNGIHWHFYETTSHLSGLDAICFIDQIIVSTNDIALPGVGA
jgi:hypothetical protein